jgi:hypothetical protein
MVIPGRAGIHWTPPAGRDGGDTEGRASFPRKRESTLASAVDSQFEVGVLLDRGAVPSSHCKP